MTLVCSCNFCSNCELALIYFDCDHGAGCVVQSWQLDENACVWGYSRVCTVTGSNILRCSVVNRFKIPPSLVGLLKLGIKLHHILTDGNVLLSKQPSALMIHAGADMSSCWDSCVAQHNLISSAAYLTCVHKHVLRIWTLQLHECWCQIISSLHDFRYHLRAWRLPTAFAPRQAQINDDYICTALVDFISIKCDSGPLLNVVRVSVSKAGRIMKHLLYLAVLKKLSSLYSMLFNLNAKLSMLRQLVCSTCLRGLAWTKHLSHGLTTYMGWPRRREAAEVHV